MTCIGAMNSSLGQYFNIRSKDFIYSFIQTIFWQYFSAKYGNTMKYNMIG